MDPSCLVSTVRAGGGGVMVWGIFYWHTLGPLVPTEHHLNATAYLSIFADHVHPFMTTVTSLDVKLLFVFNICIHSVLCISMLYCMLSCVHLFPSLFLAALD